MKPVRRLNGLYLLLVMVISLAASLAHASNDVHDLLDEIDRAPTTQSAATPTQEPITGSWPLIQFFLPVLAVAAATGVCGAVLGTFVLRRGEALMALALPQAVAVGAAIGMRLGWPELPPALVVVALALFVFSRDQRVTFGRSRGPTAVPALYVGALCLSFLIIAHGGQHVEELQNLFTGVDVAVTPLQAIGVTPVLGATALAVALLWRRWLLLAQLPATAELAGVSVARWHAIFLSALAVYVLLGTATQGVVMVLAMLFLPAAVVGPWVKRLPTAVYAGAVASVVILITAFWASNTCSWPLSHSVGGVGLAMLIVSLCASSGVAGSLRH